MIMGLSREKTELESRGRSGTHNSAIITISVVFLVANLRIPRIRSGERPGDNAGARQFSK